MVEFLLTREQGTWIFECSKLGAIAKSLGYWRCGTHSEGILWVFFFFFSKKLKHANIQISYLVVPQRPQEQTTVTERSHLPCVKRSSPWLCLCDRLQSHLAAWRRSEDLAAWPESSILKAELLIIVLFASPEGMNVVQKLCNHFTRKQCMLVHQEGILLKEGEWRDHFEDIDIDSILQKNMYSWNIPNFKIKLTFERKKNFLNPVKCL